MGSLELLLKFDAALYDHYGRQLLKQNSVLRDPLSFQKTHTKKNLKTQVLDFEASRLQLRARDDLRRRFCAFLRLDMEILKANLPFFKGRNALKKPGKGSKGNR